MTPSPRPRELWEINYQNWLANEQLTDTPDRKEAFQTGWEWAMDTVRERLVQSCH